MDEAFFQGIIPPLLMSVVAASNCSETQAESLRTKRERGAELGMAGWGGGGLSDDATPERRQR